MVLDPVQQARGGRPTSPPSLGLFTNRLAVIRLALPSSLQRVPHCLRARLFSESREAFRSMADEAPLDPVLDPLGASQGSERIPPGRLPCGGPTERERGDGTSGGETWAWATWP